MLPETIREREVLTQHDVAVRIMWLLVMRHVYIFMLVTINTKLVRWMLHIVTKSNYKHNTFKSPRMLVLKPWSNLAVAVMLFGKYFCILFWKQKNHFESRFDIVLAWLRGTISFVTLNYLSRLQWFLTFKKTVWLYWTTRFILFIVIVYITYEFESYNNAILNGP